MPECFPGSATTVSPSCKTPDSTRPNRTIFVALEPLVASVIDIRRGRSKNLVGGSIDSNVRCVKVQKTNALQKCWALIPVESRDVGL